MGIGSYTIEIEVKAGTLAVLTAKLTYELQIRDPCLDPTYIDIKVPYSTEDISYIVTTGSAVSPAVYHIGKFTPTGPYELCGSLLITAAGNGRSSYDSATGTISIYTADPALVETREEITLKAYFSNYAEEITKRQVKINLDYLDPCKDVSVVSLTLPATSQPDLEPYYYD